ncbi:MAG: DUF898 domain-containing protein [Ramlibacter sp.]|nr:DUF898 domain-containing protein [Ramlibacter sp.]
MDTDRARTGVDAHPLEFTGRGGEFFRVWIVNLLLSIVTLGLYTPFARRRTAQYFYGNTWVAGSPLEFSAQQRRMVFGFLVLVALYVAFKLAADTGQDTAVSLFMLAGAALAPWFWGSAMRFRLGATRWRGVRLQFAASWGEIYKASWPVFALALVWMAVMALVSVISPEAAPVATATAGAKPRVPGFAPAVAGLFVLGLALSVLCIIRLEFNFKSLLVKRARVGDQAGRWKPVYGDFVKIWLATLGVFLLCVVLAGVLLGVLFGGSIAMFSGLKGGGLKAVMLVVVAAVLAVFLLLLASAPARAYREARLFQLVWSNVGVSQIARFKCDLRARRYVVLRLKNMLLTLLTLGFYRPFAMLSEYRMKTESVTLHLKGGVDQLAGQLVVQQGGLGDAVADAVGLDLVG